MKKRRAFFLAAVLASAIAALVLGRRTVVNAQETLGNLSFNFPTWLDEYLTFPANRNFTPEPGKASVYVYRHGFTGRAITLLHVALDGRDWGALPRNTFQLVTVSPGQHSVVVAGGTRPLSVTEAAQNMIAEANRNYFYMVSIHFGWSKGQAAMDAMSEAKGREEIAKSRRTEGEAEHQERVQKFCGGWSKLHEGMSGTQVYALLGALPIDPAIIDAGIAHGGQTVIQIGAYKLVFDGNGLASWTEIR